MRRLVDDEAIIDHDETASDLEDAKVAAVPQEKCLARKAKRSSSQMSVIDRNENATENEDMTVRPESQKEHKHMKTMGNSSDSYMDVGIKTTENTNKKSDGIVENQRRRKEKRKKQDDSGKEKNEINQEEQNK